MKCSLLLAALATGSLAASPAGNQQRVPRVVLLDTYKNPSDPLGDHFRRKRDTVEADLENRDTLYFINAAVGTPRQDVRLHLDTGSSDMWVNIDSSSLCSSRGSPCKQGGTYDAQDSSSSREAGPGFNISYADGSGASGDYVTDTFHLGSISLPDFQFGVADESSAPRGILGIGYATNEVQVLRDDDAPYNNLPLKLVADGHTTTAAYSIYLNDLGARRGSILFGGVDRARYHGELTTLPVQSEDDEYSRILVTLTGLKLDGETVADDMALAVLLDTGASLTYLPDGIVSDLYEAVGASYSSQEGVAFVPCSLRDEPGSLDFTFTSPTISVPLDELVLDLTSSSRRRQVGSDDGESGGDSGGRGGSGDGGGSGANDCVFGVAPTGDSGGSSVLGDTFLRSAYVVFDLGNNEVSIAQAKLNSSESDVQEIKPGEDGVPGSTKVRDPVQAEEGLKGEGGQGGGERTACSLASTWAAALFSALAVL